MVAARDDRVKRNEVADRDDRAEGQNSELVAIWHLIAPFANTLKWSNLKKNDVFHEAINLKPISETDHFSINDEAYTASLDTNKKIPYLVGFYLFRLSH